MKLLEKMRQQKLLSATLLLFTLTLGILIGTVINTQVNAAKDQNVAPDATPLTVPKVAAIGNEFSALAKKLEPSVVNINVEIDETASGKGRQKASSGGDDFPFHLFGGPDADDDTPAPDLEGRKAEASGTGFIVDKNGYIVTNNHVVENALKIRVKLHDDSNEYRARVIGTDYESDLAVIKIDAHRALQPVAIANSDSVQVGDWAVAIGSPFGLEATVTAGIVSATARNRDQLPGARAFQHFIQTDAAINPGNSGGPLLNIKGEVIGVNTMIATSSGASEGVGFALPMNTVARVYNDLIREGRVTRSSLGVNLAMLDKPEATLKALGVEHGAIVDDVKEGGPAAKGGLKKNDIIVAVNDHPVKDNDDLIARVADIPVGAQTLVSIDRDGRKLDLKVTTQDRMELYSDTAGICGPSKGCQSVKPLEASAAKTTVEFGFTPRSLSDQERDTVDTHRGVMVTGVEKDSFAEEIGLEKKDIIDSINRQPINSRDDIVKIMEKLKPGDPVTFHIVREVSAIRNTKGGGVRREASTRTDYLSGYLPR